MIRLPRNRNMLEELRYRHHWIFGQTGTGKTSYLLDCALKDIHNGRGVMVIDPHGTDTLLKQIPKHRHEDIVLFDLSDSDYPIAWNPLERGDAYTASLFTETLKAIWGYADISTPQLDQVLYNATVAMLDTQDGTLLGMNFLLSHSRYRQKIVENIKDPVVRAFWDAFDDLSKKDQNELVRSTANKIQMLVADPRIRNVVAQPQSRLRLDEIMDNEQILIVRLPLQVLGQQKVGIIGSLLLAQCLQYVPQNGKPFHIYIDDVQYFQTPVVKTLLAFAGRYHVSLTVTNQYLSQLRPDLQAAFIGNIGTKTAFRTGVADATELDSEFEVDNISYALHELPPYRARIVTPVSAMEQNITLEDYEPIDSPAKLLKLSRRSYASQRKHIEPKIAKFVENLLHV